MKKLVLGILICQVLLISSSPSFDCRKARNNAEYTVCGSETLSQLDKEMANKYFKLKKQLKKSKFKKLLKKQRSWIKKRKKKCSSRKKITQCSEFYEEQISFFDLKLKNFDSEVEGGIGKKMCNQGKKNCLILGGTRDECKNWCR